MAVSKLSPKHKKELESRLESLSPREAFWLQMAYGQEAHARGVPPARSPPVQALWAAWQNRTAKAQQAYPPRDGQGEGEPAPTQESRYFLGFLLLTQIAAETNEFAKNELTRLFLRAERNLSHLDSLFLADIASSAAQEAQRILIDASPRPASYAEYDRLVAWAEQEAYVNLAEVGFQMALAAAGKTGQTWDYPPGHPISLESAACHARLAGMVKSGELCGGQAVRLPDCYDWVLLDQDGTIPAWAALRAAWRPYLYQQHKMVREDTQVDPAYLDGRMVFWDGDGEISGDRLLGLVKAYYRYCRSRPWGEEVAARVDAAALARFLAENDTPLTAERAPDLGRVAWDIFRAWQGEDSERWNPAWVATAGSLTAKARQLAAGRATFSDTLTIREHYYQVRYAAARRASIARISRRLKLLQVNHKTFTYEEAYAEDVVPPGALMGIQFITPLQESVQELGTLFGLAATFRQVCQELSTAYLGGFPILVERQMELLQQIEQTLARAEQDLAGWLQRVEEACKGVPLRIDLTSLTLVKGAADEEQARRKAGDLVTLALRAAELEEGDYDLGTSAGQREPQVKQGAHK